MPAALPLQNKISYVSQSGREYRIQEIKYGNGYAQRAKDGINSIIDKWTVEWENISLTDYQTVLTAMDASFGTDYFTWTAPGDAAQKKWVVRTLSKRAVSGNFYSISAELEQVFDL